MKKMFKKALGLLRLEAGSSYRFPIVEALTAICVFIAFNNALSAGFPVGFRVEMPEDLLPVLEQQVSAIVRRTIGAFAYLLVFVVPMITSFTVAKCFEDGTFQTLLTYPTKRSTVLGTKVSIALLLPATMSTLAATSAIYLTSPLEPHIDEIILLNAALWLFVLLLTSVTTLMSIVLRRAAASAIGGAGLWFSVATLMDSGGVSGIAKSLLLPLSAASNFILQEGAITITSLLVGFAGSLVITAVSFALSFLLFERSEL